MGATILQSIRKIDHGCRYGGEEFVVVLPESPVDSGLIVGRRIASTFASTPAWAELGIDPPTLSIGVSCQEGGEEGVDADGLVKRADDAMYAVKRRGGNGIESG